MKNANKHIVGPHCSIMPDDLDPDPDGLSRAFEAVSADQACAMAAVAAVLICMCQRHRSFTFWHSPGWYPFSESALLLFILFECPNDEDQDLRLLQKGLRLLVRYGYIHEYLGFAGLRSSFHFTGGFVDVCYRACRRRQILVAA